MEFVLTTWNDSEAGIRRGIDYLRLDFDDKARMDVLSKALRFLLNLRARYR